MQQRLRQHKLIQTSNSKIWLSRVNYLPGFRFLWFLLPFVISFTLNSCLVFFVVFLSTLLFIDKLSHQSRQYNFHLKRKTKGGEVPPESSCVHTGAIDSLLTEMRWLKGPSTLQKSSTSEVLMAKQEGKSNYSVI